MSGRYAPSPSGDLHFGNLRTAALAWLFARHRDLGFLLRVEDIDEQRSSPESARRQLADLAAIGVTWDNDPPLYQSQRYPAYEAALGLLPTFECYCTRRDIQEAARAPHAAPGAYPGTCRDLTDLERARKRAELAEAGRTPAVRLRAEVTRWRVEDRLRGEYIGEVDDFVLRRGGQEPGWAYHLAVVVDDGHQQVTQVVRGDDLLDSAPRQAYLSHLLGQPPVEFVHVPLVLNEAGRRLAKRDGAVTLREMGEVAGVVEKLCSSLGYDGATSLAEVSESFDPARVPAEPFIWRR